MDQMAGHASFEGGTFHLNVEAYREILLEFAF